ncbi:FHA domain-containing protein PS1 isoform X3 [Telopea speciosissima]|uniref:FHA domain-containing protein PS1 isoform X3 n=1 Tax=Telopea speciosissima TaxID=54955 RepID=UPI001CC618CA|nr:FHA domain-containing protein PS1 isoform X3 [Telopea speciosissima]
MADKKKKNEPVKEEKKIPVFTVLKNGYIFKNIFLIDSPPSISEEPKSIESSGNSDRCNEEILIVGRHPDCNIMLEHPSISRFHLKICSKPSLQKLSVMDLSSAHGTWISGEKIEPQVLVELNEGDTLRLGASTRIYRLHWMLLSQAFNVETPFISPSDALPYEEEEEEEEEEEKTNQDENSTPVVEGMSPSAPPPPPPETLNFSFPEENLIKNSFVSASDALRQEEEIFQDENSAPVVVGMSPSASPPQETMNSFFPVANSMAFEHKQIPSAPPMPESMNSSSPDEGKGVEEEEVMSAGERVEVGENQSPLGRILDKPDMSTLWSETVVTESVNSSLPMDEVLSEITALQLDKENQSPQVLCSTEVLSERENQETPLKSSEKKNKTPNLWSRRGKPVSVLQIQTGKSKGKSVGDSISVRTETENQKCGKENPISRVLFPHLNGEEEIFTPDKENFSPITLLLKSMKKVKVDENMHLKLCKSSSSKITADSSVDPEEELFSSDKENQTSVIFKERKVKGIESQTRARLETGITDTEKGLERVPFQSLLSKSISKSRSKVSVSNATTRSSNSVNCAQAIQKNSNPSSSNQHHKDAKKKWNMVVDTTCLLNKESRRSLKLLQGLKGTQLIIPRMVIRELDCLKRRGCLFGRESDVSSVLKWIEECMVKTKWWIHVQSSVEETRPIAPTPPASPGFSEASNGGFAGGSTCSVPFSSFGSLSEIVSPTAEDHILECALLFKRIKIDEQIILLSNDVTTKIKAMAEGLLCETAKEFRESLVNPYSKRFLWAESTPRGPTWSCVDDIVLRENYYKRPVRKSTPRGLKLILLHNSQYGQTNSVNNIVNQKG